MARLQVLGGFRLTAADGRDATPRGAKARALLAYVALSPEGGADRGRLGGLLWSESADAKTSLRQCLKEIRRTLAEAGLDLLATDTQRVQLDLARLSVDAVEVQELARSGERRDMAAMAAIYAGDLLEGLDARDPQLEEWLLIERARLRQRVCGALETALRRCLDSGDHAGGAEMAQVLLTLEPAHEEAHRALMRGHGLAGDVAAAVRQYETCRQALARGLDLRPSPETEALLREIRGGSIRRPSPGPVLLAPDAQARTAQHASVAIEQRVLATGDAADEAVLAALAMSVREALSRVRWLSVVEERSLRLAGAAPEPDYRVSLGVLRGRERVRFAVDLKSVGTGRIVWAEHYDRPLGSDIFDLVDGLSAALVSRLDREVELAEVMRAWLKPVETLSAYDCVLRAIPLIFKMTQESFAEAERLLIQAQETDPYEPLVYAWRAFWYFLDIGQGWAKDATTAKAELAWLVRRAIELDPKSALALAVAGHIASFVHHDYELALSYFDQSLQLDPNSVYAWDLSAITLCYTGRAPEALARLQRCREIWQHDPNPFFFRTSACIAHLLAGEYEQAISLGRRTLHENPNFQAAYRPLIASLGQAGRVEEAQGFIATLRRMEPDFSVGWFRASYPPLHADYTELYLQGLRKAGVPEE